MKQSILFLAFFAVSAIACNGNKNGGLEPDVEVAIHDPRTIPLTPIDRKRVPRLEKSEYWTKVRKGKLRILVGRNAAPFAVRSKDKLTGFDIEVAQQLGKVLGVELEFIELPTTKDIFDALTGPNPKGDIALGALTRTAKRAARVNFSHPYMTISQAAIIDRRLISGENQGAEITKESYESANDLAKISGLRIGVKADTTPEQYARAAHKKANITSFPTLRDAFAALQKGAVDTVIHDSPFIRLWDKQNAGQRYRFKMLLKPVTTEPLCIAIRKGDIEFLRWLDVFIEQLETNGVLASLRRRYIVEMTWLAR